jgi:hypothetical protein
MGWLLDAGGVVAALVLFASTGWLGWLAAHRLLPDGPASARLAAAATVLCWGLQALFWPLAVGGAFHPAAIALLAAAAVLAHRHLDGASAGAALRSDLARIREAFRGLGPARWLVAAGFVLPALKLLRSLIAPPLAWDSLTYHFLHAGRFVQAAGLVSERAPDAAGYYQHFPVGGEIVWAWAMLPLHGDLLVGAAGALAWLALVLGAGAAARALGASERSATLTALAAALAPVFLSLITSGYVDHLVAALFALGATFVARGLRTRAAADAALAVMALGAGLAVKISMAPLVGVALLGALVLLRGRRAPALLALSLIGAAPYLRTWVETGSPLHPLPVTVLGVRLSEGSEEFRLVHHGELLPPDRPPTRALELAQRLVWGSRVGGWPHLNFGLGLIPLALAGVVGGARLLARSGTRGTALFLLFAALVNAGLFLSDTFVAWRLLWWSVSGRLAGVAFVALALLGAGWTGRVPDALRAAALALALGQASLGFGENGWIGVAGAGGLVVLAGALLFFGARPLARRGWRRAALALGVALAAGVGAGLGAIRAGLRDAIRADATSLVEDGQGARTRAWDAHPLNPPNAASWPIWAHFDRGPAHRLAVTSGWDGLGHNAFRYPLLGSRLQNEVLYVPVTRDGSIIDYRRAGDVVREADFEAWWRRLVEARVDHLVLLGPPNMPELDWVEQHPDRFEPAVPGVGHFSLAFRVRR